MRSRRRDLVGRPAAVSRTGSTNRRVALGCEPKLGASSGIQARRCTERSMDERDCHFCIADLLLLYCLDLEIGDVPMRTIEQHKPVNTAAAVVLLAAVAAASIIATRIPLCRVTSLL